MLENEGVALKAIRWSEIFPWLAIGKSLRLAVSPRLLVFGAAALLLTLAGWFAIAAVFRHDIPLNDSWCDAFANRNVWQVIDGGVPNRPLTIHAWPFVAYEAQGPEKWLVPPSVLEGTPNAPPVPLPGARYTLSRPVLQLFSLVVPSSDRPLSATDFLAVLLSCFWSLAVWAYFGAAISRVAAVELAVGERVGWGASLRWVLRKWPAYFAAPLLPMIGVAIAAAPIVVLGLLMKLDFFVAVAGLIWPLALAAGLVMTLLLVGVLLGWPLMWATISVEGTDSFDAISRSYAYVLQRPFRYLTYVVIAVIVGWAGWIVVENIAAAVIWLAAWAASWGIGNQPGSFPHNLDTSSLGHFGAVLIAFWNGCVKLLALGYLFSYFGVATTAVYYQIRRDVDARETDEVFLDADQSERGFGLPRIQKDAAVRTEIVAAEGESSARR